MQIVSRRRVPASGLAGASQFLPGCWFPEDTVTRNIRVIAQAGVASLTGKEAVKLKAELTAWDHPVLSPDGSFSNQNAAGIVCVRVGESDLTAGDVLPGRAA